MTDTISVIIPIYRVENYLGQCVESIIKQTYKNLEIILVDDGSDDNCPKICDEFEKVDSRIKVIHKENGGADSARKAGILESTGKYIGYVDGDDWIEPTMYQKLLKYAKTHQVDIVESGVIDSCGAIKKRRVSYFKEGCYKEKAFSNEIGPKSLYTGEFFRHGISPYLVTKLFLRERIFKYQIMPEPTGNIVDDVMCTFPSLIEARSIYITHECFYNYRVRENSAKREIRNDIAPIVMKCYPEWITRFKGAIPSDNIETQIQCFTMYLLIAKAIFSFDKLDSKYFLTPFGKIKKTDRIVLYGAGTVGVHLQHYIENTLGSNLVYWADKNFNLLQGRMDIRDPKKINDQDYDFVVISILAEQAVISARNDLISIGIKEERIMWIAPEYLEEPMKLLNKAMYEGERIIT